MRFSAKSIHTEMTICINLVEIKNVERKNIESIINAPLAHTNHMQMQYIDPSADYSRSVDERVY
jgi:hypothetical protein